MYTSIFKTMGSYIRSALILLFFLYLGKSIQYITYLPISGSILGMLFLFSGLFFRLVPLDYILPSGKFLIDYITLFFVPVGVGLIQHKELLTIHWPIIIISSVGSTIIVLVSVGWIFQKLAK